MIRKISNGMFSLLIFCTLAGFSTNAQDEKAGFNSVLENENDIRIKQMDDAIEKALPLKTITDKLDTIFEQYQNKLNEIENDSQNLNEILSKYRPMIEQMLKYSSIVAKRQKDQKLGNVTKEKLLAQRKKLTKILKKIDEILNTSDRDFDNIRQNLDTIMKEIQDTLKEQVELNKNISAEELEEQIANALSIIENVSSEIQKNIINDANILNFIDQKREELKKLAWLNVQKGVNEIVDEIKKIADNSADALKPLTSENVEHIILRVHQRALNARQKAAKRIFEYAGISFSQKKFNEAKDRFELARKIYADIVFDVNRLSEKIHTDTVLLNKIAQSSQKQVDYIVSLEEKCEKEIAVAQFRDKTSLESIDSGRQARLNDIEVNLAKAEILIRNQEYMQARDALETVLMRDPYNMKATRMLKSLYEKLFDIAKVRRYNEYLETITINEWNWNEAVLPRPAEKPIIDLPVKQTDKTSIASKLNDIVIPRIEFEDTSLNSAIQWLMNESKNHDTSAQRTGVPIMLQLTQDQITQLPSITLILDDVPIGEVIRYICQATGLKYRVEDRAVIISSEIQTFMETRFFKVRAQVIKSIAPNAGEENAEANLDSIDLSSTFKMDVAAGATRQSSVTSEQLKTYFTERGVPFTDSEATIAYDQRSGKLIAKNTPENLRRLETLLREIDVETPLVLIETKFVEITQTDLEELGFEYLFSKDPNVPLADQNDTSSWWEIIQNESTMRTLGINASGIPSPVNDDVNSRLINNLQLPAFGAGKRYNLSFFLHALDRSQSIELLSAPKVIATSGEEAVIRMIRLEYYPENWTEPEIEVREGYLIITPSRPEFGEPTDVGIRLVVTPTVSPNNYTINLNLSPQITERIGWTDYSYEIIIAGRPNIPATLIMRELSNRQLNTNVKIFDGETLVVGGMIRDHVSSVDDRLPILGDIPIFGRLARTDNEQKIKRNLIIFITARLVNPDGVPIRAGKMRGLFDFRR